MSRRLLAVVAAAAALGLAVWSRLAPKPCRGTRGSGCCRHDRHAARRRGRRLGNPNGATPWLDRLAARGRRFDGGPRAQRGHAALAREHPHRPLPLPARRARQQRLPLPGRRDDPRDACSRRTATHRRLRQRVPARLALRARPRLRRLRRPLRGGPSDAAPSRCPERRAATTVARGACAGSARGDGPSRSSVGAPLRARTRRTSRPSRSPHVSRATRTTARSRPPTRRSAASAPILDPGPSGRTLVVLTADHGESLGEHGEQTHGLFAYEATLRVPLVIYAPRLLRPGVVTRARAPRGHPADDPRRARDRGRRPASTGRSLLGLLAGAARAAGAPRYFEALSASLNRGWAPLCGAARRSAQVHRAAAARALRPRRRPGEPETSRPLARRTLSGCAGCSASCARATRREALAEAGDARAPARPRLRRARPRPAARTLHEEDDPKRLIEVDAKTNQMLTLYRQGHRRGDGSRPREHRRRPDMPLALITSPSSARAGRPAGWMAARSRGQLRPGDEEASRCSGCT